MRSALGSLNPFLSLHRPMYNTGSKGSHEDWPTEYELHAATQFNEGGDEEMCKEACHYFTATEGLDPGALIRGMKWFRTVGIQGIEMRLGLYYHESGGIY